MSFPDLRSFLRYLERAGDLARVGVPVDTEQEVTVIQHLTLPRGGPAVLFENVTGSPYRLVTNLFGTMDRVEKVFGKHPAEIGNELVSLVERLVPPTVSRIWKERGEIRRILRARLRNVRSGPVTEEVFSPPEIDRLPCLTCWPMDGGPFFTLPLVHTVDPVDGRGNLGIYRMQRYDSRSTGMHWQIQKGGGFHFERARSMGVPLPVSVLLGGPPALTIAAVAPLPEGVDERLLAALMIGRPLDVILRKETGHRIPAQCEFVLEGSVTDGDLVREGPFGDHLGHYSYSADFPVFRVSRMLARRDGIFPATVVGKPPQEDYYIGCALQEMSIPVLKLMKPGVRDLWAYPETGFHPMAVLSVDERYPREALKQALSVLGEGQLSLTKVLMVVDGTVDVRDINKVSEAMWRWLDPSDGIHLIAPTAQDTLDFTGPAMNTGSRLILMATPRNWEPLRDAPPKPLPDPAEVHDDISEMASLGPAFLIARLRDGCDPSQVREALGVHPATSDYLFHVMVSADVPLDDPMMILWGWFTRFDPLADLHPARREQAGNRLILHLPIAIDATWKKGYRQPVSFDPEVESKVRSRWDEYGIELPALES